MLVLDKQNMIPYLQKHYPDFCSHGSIIVSEIGDSEEDNPGLINHILRVSNGKDSMIVKQGLYILTQMVESYEYFVCYFKDFWDNDAKEHYRSCPAWRDKLMEGFLPDVIGFACLPTFAVTLSDGDGWMDIAAIPDPEDRRNIKYMLVVLCRHLLLNRFQYRTIHEAVEDIVRVCEDFLGKL